MNAGKRQTVCLRGLWVRPAVSLHLQKKDRDEGVLLERDAELVSAACDHQPAANGFIGAISTRTVNGLNVQQETSTGHF